MIDVYTKMRKPADECYTELDDAECLAKYIKNQNVISINSKIWMPSAQMFNNEFLNGELCAHGSEIGLLMPRTRMNFIVNGVHSSNRAAFYCFWLCYKTKIKGFIKLEKDKLNKISHG